MSANAPRDERMMDLLCEMSVRGLGEAERRELESLGIDPAELEAMERTVAAVDVAMAPPVEAMPASLRASLLEAGRAFERGAATPAAPALRLAGAEVKRMRAVAAGGWLAAAACLVVAGLVWVSRPGGLGAPAAVPLGEAYAALAAKPGVVKTAWLGLDDLLKVDPHRYDHQLAGEVVWDPATQTGYMKFTGLAANTPSEFQYQLWIFDAERRVGDLPQFAIAGLPEILTQRPVDGGVFDVGSEGEVIVPIDAKLPVGKAALFAVTVEPPGGVVVSDRDIVVAAVAG